MKELLIILFLAVPCAAQTSKTGRINVPVPNVSTVTCQQIGDTYYQTTTGSDGNIGIHECKVASGTPTWPGSSVAGPPFTSSCVNPALTGFIRGCKTDTINLRNNANAGDVPVASLDTNDRVNIGGTQGVVLGSGTLGKVTAARFSSSQGTQLVAGDFALSGGWGTSSSVTSPSGTDMSWQITVNAGTASLTANPTIVLTFKDGAWPNGAPNCSSGMQSGGTGNFAQMTCSTTTTTMTVTYNALPIASSTYVIFGQTWGIKALQ